VAGDWLINKIMRLHHEGNSGTVPNPTLEEMCELLSRAVAGLTPAAQKRAFEHCLLTLPTDGSLDEEKGSKNLMALMRKYGETLVPSPDSRELFPEEDLPDIVCEGMMTGVFTSIFKESSFAQEDLQHPLSYSSDPEFLHFPLLRVSAEKQKRKNRYLTKINILMPNIVLLDCKSFCLLFSLSEAI
jgi:hypothetical protein